MVLAALVNMVAPAARIAPSRVASQRVAQALRVPAFRPRVAFHAARTVSAKYASEKKGDYPSMDFRIFFSEDGKAISPWHNVPLHNADGTVNFICEIPKETKAKMEVATDEELTPIKQDTKKGKLRDYPYNINWNYGMIPQTWEDPNHEHPTMKVMGDNDPVDVVEIGAAALPMGSISPVKPVGVYAMIDDGELDWKVPRRAHRALPRRPPARRAGPPRPRVPPPRRVPRRAHRVRQVRLREEGRLPLHGLPHLLQRGR